MSDEPGGENRRRIVNKVPSLVPPKEYHSKTEVEAFEMREGLLAYEQGYDLRNVLAMSRVAQETYWKLKSGEED